MLFSFTKDREEGRDQQDHGEPDGQERAREGSYRLSSRTKSAGTGIGTPGQVQDSSQAGILVDEDCCQQPQPIQTHGN